MRSATHHLLLLPFLSVFVCLFNACKKGNDASEKTVVAKTVLVYMEANNDLRYDALNSINRMEKGATGINGTLLVYIKTNSSKSYLLKIKPDADLNRLISDTVKTFDNPTPSDPQLVKLITQYAQTEFPAQSYGLVLWSHATSWAPPVSKVKTYSFGQDSGAQMDVIDLKNALPDNLDFIIFDACSMGGVEICYEFKDKAKYIIASPAETLSESFPYQNITPLLFGSTESLAAVAKGYFDYYNAYTDDRRSATVGLIKTSELPALAAEMKNLLSQKKLGDQFIRSSVQRLDYTQGFPVPNYDFGDFLNQNFAAGDLMAINAQLGKTIVYKAATLNFLGVPINQFSGLTTYIPYTGDGNLAYYKKLQWYSASGLSGLFGM
jgi:hypothetical protein